ncbi:hypothetical protein IJM86_03905 [bacterium]|nr:hypothetical protein [bacterium]
MIMFSELDREIEYLAIRIQDIKKEIKELKREIKDLEERLDDLRIQRKMTHDAVNNKKKPEVNLEEITHKGRQIKTQLFDKQQEKDQTLKLLYQLQQDYHDKLHAKNCLLAEKIKQES